MKALDNAIRRYRLWKLRRDTKGTAFELATRLPFELRDVTKLVDEMGFDAAAAWLHDCAQRGVQDPASWPTYTKDSQKCPTGSK